MAEHRQERCATPKISRKYKYGDLWICGTCGRVWTLTSRDDLPNYLGYEADDRWELTDLRSTHVDRRPGALPPRPTTPPPAPPPSSGAKPVTWAEVRQFDARLMREDTPWEISEADDKKIMSVYDNGTHTYSKHMATCVDAATAAHIVRVHNNKHYNPQGVE